MVTQSSKSAPTKSIGATSAIRRFLMTIVEGSIFSTRDLLSLGARSAIDSALSRLVAASRIVRLASGLYMIVKASDPDWRPTAEAIIQAKLLAFRRIGVEAQTPSNDTNKTSASQGSAPVTYEISGNRSKFRLFNGIFVHLKPMANRKLDLAQSELGRKLKNLWQSVEHNCDERARTFLRELGREEKADVKVLLPLLPQKLSDCLGAPWNHKGEVYPLLRQLDDCLPTEWFSLYAITQSRSLRSTKHPQPLLEVNY